jgi:aryl-alcohol dehydrogenase-like predicted oxidoreductase
VLTEVADEVGVTRNHIVLAWLTGGAPAVTPIVGVSSVAQMEEALAGAALGIPGELRARLDAVA